MQWLLDNNANVNAKDKDGNGLLINFIKNLDKIHELHYKLSSITIFGYTIFGYIGFIRFLKQHGADLNLK